MKPWDFKDVARNFRMKLIFSFSICHVLAIKLMLKSCKQKNQPKNFNRNYTGRIFKVLLTLFLILLSL